MYSDVELDGESDSAIARVITPYIEGDIEFKVQINATSVIFKCATPERYPRNVITEVWYVQLGRVN